jgi:hypothetical protein
MAHKIELGYGTAEALVDLDLTFKSKGPDAALLDEALDYRTIVDDQHYENFDAGLCPVPEEFENDWNSSSHDRADIISTPEINSHVSRDCNPSQQHFDNLMAYPTPIAAVEDWPSDFKELIEPSNQISQRMHFNWREESETTTPCFKEHVPANYMHQFAELEVFNPPQDCYIDQHDCEGLCVVGKCWMFENNLDT